MGMGMRPINTICFKWKPHQLEEWKFILKEDISCSRSPWNSIWNKAKIERPTASWKCSSLPWPHPPFYVGDTTGWSISKWKKYQAYIPMCIKSVVWDEFSFIILCLTFFVLKFHWFSLNSLTTTSIWTKTIIYSFSLKSCLISKTDFFLIAFISN